MHVFVLLNMYFKYTIIWLLRRSPPPFKKMAVVNINVVIPETLCHIEKICLCCWIAC